MNSYETIIALAEQMQDELVAIRRDFHQFAEPGWLEMRTSSLIARTLSGLGYEVLTGSQVCLKSARMGVPADAELEKRYEQALAQGADPEFLETCRDGMTGVIGILRNGEGPTVAFRFDIDALGVFESDEADHRPAQQGFASQNYGAMHACGHDGHTAVGLGVAKALIAVRDQLHGTIKLIFQPAEEGVRGAKAIVENGHLDGVDYFIGSHLTGKAADDPADFCPGTYGGLATNKYDVVFRGLSAHAGGAPQAGKNAMLAAATAVLNLHAIPRHNAGATRINVGRLVAGSGRNVICDEATLEIEVRGDTTVLNDYMSEYTQRILTGAAQMHDCTVELTLVGSAMSMRTDEDFCNMIHQVCTEKMGLVSVPAPLLRKNSGSEDISYMMNRVQEQGGKAAFIRLMTTVAAPAHNRRYDFEETVLKQGVKAFAGMALHLLSNNS